LPPQIPLDQTRVWTRAAAVGGQRLTAWAMARSGPCAYVCILSMTAWLRALGWFFCYNCRSHAASCVLFCDTWSSLTVFLKWHHSGQSVGAFSSEYRVSSKQFPGNLYRSPRNKCKHSAHNIGLWWQEILKFVIFLPTACSS
jgi:hypothetical protein